MGCWGMGLTQSDEFCNVYEQFMEGYNLGKLVPDISKEILEHYKKEFDENDGIMHDVYFALAKAEWMCCEQSDEILKKVKEIIDSEANIEFLRELGADEKDLLLRKKNLLKFYQALTVPRKKPRKRYRDPALFEKPFPEMEMGDCFSYKYDNGKRILIVLDKCERVGLREMVFCCILKNTYQSNEISKIDFGSEQIGNAACFTSSEFLGKSVIKKVGRITVPANAMGKILGNVVAIGGKKDFKKDYSHVDLGKVSDFLESRNIFRERDPVLKQKQQIIDTYFNISKLPPLKSGDIFTISGNAKKRILLIFEMESPYGFPLWYCYALRKEFEGVPELETLGGEYIIPLGWIRNETFTPEDELNYVRNEAELCKIARYLPSDLKDEWKPADKAIVTNKNLKEDYPLTICEKLGVIMEMKEKGV